jgi:serine/threonine protein phosphatase PrpC
MEFSISLLSRIGGRENNEDRVAYVRSRDSLLLVLADGMGGHAHGEVAAEIAVRTLAEGFRGEALPRLNRPDDFLEEKLMAAHFAIAERARADSLEEIPGTTCVGCLVQDGHAWWGHAGDSRLYHVRGGRVLSRTRDHSITRQMAELSGLSEEEEAALPGRNILYSCIGSTGSPELDIAPPVPLAVGDTLLLCSDGLWGPLSDEEVGAALSGASLVRAVAELAAQAELRNGHLSDNITAIAMVWGRHEDGARPAPAGRIVRP